MDTEEFEKKYVNKIIHGNNLEIMKTFPNDCVDFVMTSSPYWSLRSYGKEAEMIWDGKEDCEHNWSKSSTLKKGGKGQNKGLNNSDEYHKIRDSDMQELSQGNYCNRCGAWKGELGLESSFEDFVRHLLIITNEIKRILKPTGSFLLNIGDTYFGGGHGEGSLREVNGRLLKDPKFGIGRNACPDKDWDFSSYNAKCMCGIPERIMLGMIDQGWLLRNKIIWFKKNSMPSSVRDRLSNTWEYIYHFVKSNKKQYWVNSKTMQLVTKQPPTPSTGKEGVDWDWEEVGIVDENVFNVRVRDCATDRFLDKATEEEEESYGKPKRKKVSNWRGWDYFYDLDAIRVPHKQASIERVLSAKQRKTQSTLDRKVDKNIGAIPQRSSIDGIVVNLNQAGRNPGDVVKSQKYDNTDQYQPIRHKGGYISPGGKNPGDVLKYDSKYSKYEHGQTLQGFMREQSIVKARQQSKTDAKKLYPNDLKKQHEYINFVHDHDGHSSGKNPGDVIRNWDNSVNQKSGNIQTSEGLHRDGGGVYHPLGSNPGDFWSINTKPFPDAHFAVFPEAIVINPLKSSCPKEVCVKCGMPKVRIVKKGDLIFGDGHTKLSNREVIDETGKSAWSGEGQRAERMIPGAFYKQKEIGYAQCSCGANFKPGIAFDPFAGSGTTLLVAKRLSYRFIGTEIVKDYVIMAKKRLGINDYYVPNSLDDFTEKICQIKPTQ